VVELDKTRETLAVKSINKPLTYTVKEVALDLNIFPAFDGEQVTFVTAQPGEEGASKVSISLNSITDQQVRATSKMPTAKDVPLEDVEVDAATRSKLRKLGVSSVDDLEQIERRDVDLRRVSGDDDIDYSKLANQIRKTQRGQAPPRVTAVSLSIDEDGSRLVVQGENLAVDPAFEPVAVVNSRLADVASSSDRELQIRLDDDVVLEQDTELVVTFDPFAVVRMNVRT
jgi:hypothetical protein